MATGIFSTTRVAGEGLALAIVAAALSALVANQLVQRSAVPAEVAAAVAQRLVAGDLSGAVQLWHPISPAAMASVYQTAYQSAFATLARVLASVTAATAVMVFAFLGCGSTQAVDPAPQSPGRDPHHTA